MISVVETKNWKITSPLLRLFLDEPAEADPFKTLMVLKENKKNKLIPGEKSEFNIFVCQQIEMWKQEKNKQESQYHRQHRKKNGFCEKLKNQFFLQRSHHFPDAYLARSLHGTRGGKIGKVDAGEQKYKNRQRGENINV